MIVYKVLFRYFVFYYFIVKEMLKYISLCVFVIKFCIILYWVERKISSVFIIVLWNNYIFLDFFIKLVIIIFFIYYFYFLFSNRYFVLVFKEVDGLCFVRLFVEKNKNYRKVLCVY